MDPSNLLACWATLAVTTAINGVERDAGGGVKLVRFTLGEMDF